MTPDPMMPEAGAEMEGETEGPDVDPDPTDAGAAANMSAGEDEQGGEEFAQAERVSSGCQTLNATPQASLILLLLGCPLLRRRLRRRV